MCADAKHGQSTTEATRAASRLFRGLTRADSSLSIRLCGFARGGTVNRPCAHVSHRKQTTAHMQGRNFPVHFLFRFARRFAAPSAVFRGGVGAGIPVRYLDSSKVHRALDAGARKLHAVPEHQSPTNHYSPLTNHAFLPGTVNRVETHLSHRKQTIGHTSTRNVPVHGCFRVLFAANDEFQHLAEAKYCRAKHRGASLLRRSVLLSRMSTTHPRGRIVACIGLRRWDINARRLILSQLTGGGICAPDL